MEWGINNLIEWKKCENFGGSGCDELDNPWDDVLPNPDVAVPQSGLSRISRLDFVHTHHHILVDRSRKIPPDEAFYLEDSFYPEIRAPILVVSRE